MRKGDKMTRKTEGARHHHYWAIAFIDLLGHKRDMLGVSYVPDANSPEQMERFMAAYHEAYHKLEAFHKSALLLKEIASRDEPTTIRLTTERQKAAWRSVAGPQMKHQRFADGDVFCISLEDWKEHAPVTSIYNMIAGCGTMILSCLSAKISIRGGLDIGTGMEMWSEEVYGHSACSAYILESEIAQYPRIVVGPTFLHYLYGVRDSAETSDKAEYEKKLAVMCLRMLAVDVHGAWFIDYLGELFKEFYDASGHDVKSVFDAYEFVLAQNEKWEKAGNVKLASRYDMLREYFESHLARWG